MEEEYHRIIKGHRMVVIAALLAFLRGTSETLDAVQDRQQLAQVIAAIREELDTLRQQGIAFDPLMDSHMETVLLDASELALSILDGMPPYFGQG